MAAKDVIKTLVFMDLETTGLERPRITEVCMIAVDKTALTSCNVTSLPRVQNKLLLCVNPARPINFHASDITGLYNDDLEDQHTWDKETAEMVSKFISRLPQPTCFIAHNGNRFDFPVLHAEMERAGVKFESTIFCADTMLIFQSIDLKDYENLTSIVSSPVLCESPIVTTAMPKPPDAPRKSRDLIVDFDMSKAKSYQQSECGGESDVNRFNTPKSLVGKTARNSKSVKRNLLGDFNNQATKKSCTVTSMNENCSPATMNHDEATNEVSKMDTRDENVAFKEDFVSNEDLMMNEANEDLVIKDEDVKAVVWSSSWDDDEFSVALDDMKELSPDNVKKENISGDYNRGRGDMVCGNGKSDGVKSENKQDVKFDTKYRNDCNNDFAIKSGNLDFRARSEILNSESAGFASESVNVCTIGELTPEKRGSEVYSPPKTPTKPEKVVFRNYTFSRSLNDSFTTSLKPQTVENVNSPGLSSDFHDMNIVKTPDCKSENPIPGELTQKSTAPLESSVYFSKPSPTSTSPCSKPVTSLSPIQIKNAGKLNANNSCVVSNKFTSPVSSNVSPITLKSKDYNSPSRPHTKLTEKVNMTPTNAKFHKNTVNTYTIITAPVNLNQNTHTPPTNSKTNKNIHTTPTNSYTTPKNTQTSTTPQYRSASMGVSSGPPKKSYKLIEIYRRYFGEAPPNSHSAEDDCISMMRLAVARSRDFCQLVDEQSVPLESITYRRR